jgi:hypothetical protein
MNNFDNDEVKNKFKELLRNKKDKREILKSELVRKEAFISKVQSKEKSRIFRRKSI